VVYKEPSADGGSGMYLHACNETGGMRNHTSEQSHLVLPQEVRHAMVPYRMQAGIAEKNLKRAPGRRVFFEYGSQVFPQQSKHVFQPRLF
jgi:hypothetical protein